MKLFLIILILLAFNAKGFGQQYSFVNYSVEDGLAQTQVFVLSSDSDGYLWIGTAGGVSRFDGRKFKNYSTESGLLGNTVKNIVNYNNRTWIASQYGITSVRGKEVISWDLTSIASGNGITAFTFDKKNNLWLAVRGRGIYRIPLIKNKLNLAEISHYSLNEDNNIKTIYCDKKGTIWIGGWSILSFFEHDVWKNNEALINNKVVTCFGENKEGALHFSTSKNGIYAYDKTQFKQIVKPKSIGVVNHIYFDTHNSLWVSSKKGAYTIKEGAITHYSETNGLVNNQVKFITEDRENNIWIGTDGGGIARFASNELISFSKKDGLSSDYVLSVLEDEKSNIYFSTYGGGLNIYDGEKVRFYNTNNQLGDNTIWSSLYNKDSSCWFGTAGGLSILKNKKIKTFDNQEWITSPKILSLFNDDTTNWIGTSKGISAINKNGTKDIYKYPDNFPARNIRTIEKGFDNKIWVGTSNGIFIKNKSEFIPFEFNASLQNKIVYTIKKIREDRILIGTANGLYSFDGNNLVRIELHESFSANTINFIGIENSNYIWVGTNYGIFELNLLDSTNLIHHYTTTNGLPSVETNLNAFFKDSKGFLWMGTSKGVVRFKRKHSNHKKIAPKVEIDKVQLFLKNTNWKKHSNDIDKKTNLPRNLSVGYKKNYFTFFYNAVAFKQNKEIKYKVMLQGFDSEWSPAVMQEAITYTNLPHGNYTFKVKTATENNQWSEPAEFAFTIRKPFYLTIWFFLLVFIFILIITILVWRWRLNVSKHKDLTQKLYYKNKLLALEQQSLNASMNRHFIFNSLNSIQYYINSNDRMSANKYLTNFAKLIRKNLDTSISGTNLVSLTDEFERLDLYISLEKMRFENKFEHKISIEKNIDTDNISVPPMFLQPFIENSIWHGILPTKTNGEINIELTQTKNRYLIIIEDNGVGIEESLAKKGNSNHSSKGMLITSGRLEILKKTTNKDIVIKGPFQKEDENGTILGTIVEVTIVK